MLCMLKMIVFGTRDEPSVRGSVSAVGDRLISSED